MSTKAGHQLMLHLPPFVASLKIQHPARKIHNFENATSVFQDII